MAFQFLNLGSQKSVLGVDIGSKNTKIIGLKPTKNIFKVKSFGMTPTPPDTFSSGVVADPEALSDFISKKVVVLDTISENIELILGVSGKGMIAKKIDIPEIEDYMIPEYIEIEAEQELFYNKEEMYLEYQILKNINANKPESKSLFAMTVLKKIVESYTNAIPKDLVSCDIIDTNFSALFNIFEYNKDLNSESIYMVVDVGYSMTNVIVICQNQLVFARSLSLGGDFFTQEISKMLSLDYQSAEDLKLTASQGENSPEDIVDLIKKELVQKFLEELVSCYELYLSFYPEKLLNELYLTGGGSQTLGLAEAVKDKFQVPVKFFNPFQKIKKPQEFTKADSLFFSIAAGLVLRGVK